MWTIQNRKWEGGIVRELRKHPQDVCSSPSTALSSVAWTQCEQIIRALGHSAVGTPLEKLHQLVWRAILLNCTFQRIFVISTTTDQNEAPSSRRTFCIMISNACASFKCWKRKKRNKIYFMPNTSLLNSLKFAPLPLISNLVGLGDGQVYFSMFQVRNAWQGYYMTKLLPYMSVLGSSTVDDVPRVAFVIWVRCK